MSTSIWNIDNTCIEIELSSEIDRFQNASERSRKYEIQDYVLNGRPVYYNKESKRYIYATIKGLWVVISKYNLFYYKVTTNLSL